MLFLINLDSATERRASMLAQLDDLDLSATRIGVDLRGLGPARIDAVVAQRFPGIAFDHDHVSSAEIGCWASHLTAWTELARRRRTAACTVLEDDLALDADLPAAIAELTRQPVNDLVFLGTSCRNVSTRHHHPAGRFELHRPIGTIYNTWGYVITRAWVTRFFAARPWRIDRPIDHYTGGRRAGSLKPRVAVLRPPVVREDPALGVASQIEPYTFRLDRTRIVEYARRRILASRVSALYYRLYRFL
ncbi:MAG TPA: glycosyltransferase family 25 protein [Casimicrobiaceae bacterium]|nr:glycosyltransferase family 25 protein [Casimicrobiaceae bacterium]